jgi:hypothetical protein
MIFVKNMNIRFSNLEKVFLIALILVSCVGEKSTSFDGILLRLEGEWKESPGIGYREVWKRDDRFLTGAGYQHSGDTYSQVEELAISILDSTLVYHAVVFDQNKGRQIDFNLMEFSDSSLVFVNFHHDFPNTIGYYFINDSTLIVRVKSFSDQNSGFELELKKSRNPVKGSGKISS